MKDKKTTLHAQILLTKYPDSGPLGLDMGRLLEHWRGGMVEGEIREPMHTLFLEEGSFCELLEFLKRCEAAG